MLGRDPRSGSVITSGDGFDWTGGPLGTLLGIAGLAVVLAFFVGLTRAVTAVLPAGLVVPAVIVLIAVLGVGGLWGVLELSERRRR